MSLFSRATNTNRQRRKNDFYATVDHRAVTPLLPFLEPQSWYVEPCAGDGSLIGLLDQYGHRCLGRFDLSPQCPYIPQRDALEVIDMAPRVITNPPWDPAMLHPLIEHFVQAADETWLLFGASWPQTKQSKRLGELFCTDIVSVGRVKWFLNSKNDATDDCSWYRFSQDKDGATRYHWPAAKRVTGQAELF